MKRHTVTVCEGENMGPINWDHPIARFMPEIWRDAEKSPDGFTYNGRMILQICMYDGWPYWKPTPAIHFVGPLNSGEWDYFNSYGVRPDSIQPRPQSAQIEADERAERAGAGV